MSSSYSILSILFLGHGGAAAANKTEMEESRMSNTILWPHYHLKTGACDAKAL